MASESKSVFNRNNTNGATKNGHNKYAKLGNSGPKKPITWAQVNGPTIKDCIGFVTAAGDAITFGRTSDGGALSVTVLSGESRSKLYATTVEEAEELLMQVIEAAGT